MKSHPIFPITVYGSSISYFTGKLENYLRVKSIPYRLQALTSRYHMKIVRENTGSTQMPAVELADGRWMSDSTPIIQWFEREFPEHPVIPEDPLQRFFSLLMEDYADEWLWRPAMHYRWYYQQGALFAGNHLAAEIGEGVPVPNALKRLVIARRQRSGYTSGDGITADQVPGVEAIYRRTLEQLEAIFRQRPFLLGDRPSLADIGFSGPFFRHFGLDPVPAEIMRQQAPAVWEWAARLWNARLGDSSGSLLQGIPTGGRFLKRWAGNTCLTCVPMSMRWQPARSASMLQSTGSDTGALAGQNTASGACNSCATISGPLRQLTSNGRRPC
jgi:glutathione S-transferase